MMTDNKPLHILLIDSDLEEVNLIEEYLSGAHASLCTIDHVDRLSAGIDCLTQDKFDLVLLNLNLSDSTGPDTFSLVYEHPTNVPIIVLDDPADSERAARLIRQGAQDYLPKKELEAIRLAGAIRHAVERHAHTQELKTHVSTLDLAEQIQTKADLQKTEERFRQVITSISDHIYVTEVIEDGSRLNLYLSPNIETLTGYPYERFISDWSFWPTSVIHPEDRAAAARQSAKLTQGENTEMEYRLIRANGEVIWVRDSGKVEKKGNHIVIYGVVSDVTERKQAELELVIERALLAQRVEERTAELSIANAELARAARIKDEFLATISHELRTPLTAILGMSESLQENIFGVMNEDQNEALRYIEESGRHLLDLINDILDVTKIEAGKMDLWIETIYIHQVCEASLRFIKQMAAKKRIDISFEIDKPDIVLMADERRIKQILVNLLSNAVKFTPKGGRVGLIVESDAERELVRFIVWDTGIGISRGEMKHLFKPFVQIDSSLSRQHEGTGLGLSLVSRLTEMHGGGISLESQIGQGSRFIATLPWPQVVESETDDDEPDLPEIKIDPSAPGVQSQALILLAEDNEANIVTLQRFLQAKGYRIIVARNGTEAIARAKEERPDLILMDIQMPLMDGFEAVSRIRADARLTVVPIIALTALAMPGDRERCLEIGANDYLSKPFRLSRLVEVIETQLEGAAQKKIT